MNETLRKLLVMQIHESTKVGDLEILRVPGGWVYYYGGYNYGFSTFVPEPPTE